MAPQPTVSPTTLRWYERLPDFMRAADEAQPDWPLLRYLSLMGELLDMGEAMFERFWYVPPFLGGPPGGTSDLVDPATADAAWLPWIGQIVGVRITMDEVRADPAAARAKVSRAASGWAAGSPGSFTDALAPILLGSKKVTVNSHYLGDPWAVEVVTRLSETPPIAGGIDPVIEALLRAGVKPAGVVLYHNTYAATWATVEEAWPRWRDWLRAFDWRTIEDTLPGTLPGAVRSPRAAAIVRVAAVGPLQVDVVVNPDPDDGGAAVDDWQVLVYENDVLVGQQEMGSPTMPLTVTGANMAGGNYYRFVVIGHNQAGWGEPSAPSVPVLVANPVGVPARSVVTAVAVRSQRLDIDFEPGASGDPITEYSAQTDAAASRSIAPTDGAARPIPLVALTDGTPYRVRARAMNDLGWGQWSAWAGPYVPQGPPPAPPAAPTVEVLDVGIRVGWTDPPGPLTVRRITAYLTSTGFPTGSVWLGAGFRPLSDPFDWDGLDTTEDHLVLVQGFEYTVTVAAATLDGFGPESAPSDPFVVGDPGSFPAQPVILTIAQDGLHGVEFTYQPGARHGTAVDLVRVVASQAGSPAATAVLPAGQPVRTGQLAALVTGQRFDFTVAEHNGAADGYGGDPGWSQPSDPQSLTMTDTPPPPAPTGVTVAQDAAAGLDVGFDPPPVAVDQYELRVFRAVKDLVAGLADSGGPAPNGPASRGTSSDSTGAS